MSVGQEFNVCPTCGADAEAYQRGYAAGLAAAQKQYAELGKAIDELADRVKREAG